VQWGVEVYLAVDAADAHRVAGMLEEEGIPADVENEVLQAGLGELPASPPRVLVHEADAGRARAIVSERAREHGRTPPPASELAPRHAVAIFVVYLLAQIVAAFVLAMFGLPVGAVFVFALLAGGLVAFKLTQSVLGGSLGLRGRAMIGLVDATPAQNLLGAAVGVVSAVAYFVIAIWIMPPEETGEDMLSDIASESPLGFLYFAVLAVGIAPFVEEFLFRGVMLHAFRKRWGDVVGIVVVTLIFTAVHLDTYNYWPGLAILAAGAVVEALLRIWSGSLHPAIASHLTYNAIIAIRVYLSVSPGW
jgi:membrane protease YdiL (CAAX protease family)